MLLNAVIIVLREVLEAALLISVLLSISHSLGIKLQWLIYACIIGISGALLYKYNIHFISSAFDYAGQEVTNALLQSCVFILLAIIVIYLHWFTSSKHLFLIAFCMSGAVSLAIVREGSEVFIYLGGFMHEKNYLLSLLTGSTIGASIGLSLGALTYYALRTDFVFIPLIRQSLLAFIAASMLSQSVQQLMQVDFLPAQQALWDTSSLLSEDSIMGQLLYAIMGYEATPTPLQAGAYLFGLISIGFFMFLKKPTVRSPSYV
jgi:high-affinity iron transporter